MQNASRHSFEHRAGGRFGATQFKLRMPQTISRFLGAECSTGVGMDCMGTKTSCRKGGCMTSCVM
eukprot:15466130-Alexandrium_andersonii.AAC.1